jgi:predicted dinucleotide-binding enzyme
VTALGTVGNLAGKVVIDITNPLTPDYMGLAVRSNSSKSSGLKSRPGSCPYAPVA